MDEHDIAAGALDSGGGAAWSSVQLDFRRERRRLINLLPLYGAVTGAVMTGMFVALPLCLYLSAILFDGEGAGFAILIVVLFFLPIVPGALALALGLLAVLRNLLRSSETGDEQQRGMLDYLATWLTLLPTLLLALLYIRPLTPLSLALGALLGALLGAVAIGGVFLVFFLAFQVTAVLYFALPAGAALAFFIAAAIGMRRVALRDKRIAVVITIAGICGMAASVLVPGAIYFLVYFLELELEVLLLLLLSIAYFILQVIALLRLPLLLRASASYARLRWLDSKGRLVDGASMRNDA